jgi:hypothetical protein
LPPKVLGRSAVLGVSAFFYGIIIFLCHSPDNSRANICALARLEG